MKLSTNGLELIKRFEGYRSKAYRDGANVWTCGYGHTAGVAADTTCTQAVAEQWLRADVATAEREVARLCAPQGTVILRQCQYDALVSIIFNIGTGAFRQSRLRRLILTDPDMAEIAAEWTKWCHITVGGRKQVSDGLLARRRAEAAHYFGQ